MNSTQKILHCRWLIRSGQAPQSDQRLTVENGILVEACDVPGDERSLIQPIAILPAFVNAHTHLEFSSLQQPLQPSHPFPDWIRSVVGYRRSPQNTEEIEQAIARGLQECHDTGTALVGEICTSSTGASRLLEWQRNQSNLQAVCFRELLGFTSDRIDEQKQIANDHLKAEFVGDRSSGVRPGLSPHAPYSVHPAIVQHAAEVARSHNVPVAMHLAETPDEIQLLTARTGRFVELLEQLQLWQPETLHGIAGVQDYLQMLKDCPNALIVHANYLTPSEIAFLATQQTMSTVYCVRTHEWFHHTDHPWQQIEQAGGRVILGTDSRASNPDLNVWKELIRFCQKFPKESLINRLPMITTNAAEAIGFSASDVNLTIGRPLRCAVVRTDAETESALESSLLAAPDVTCGPADLRT